MVASMATEEYARNTRAWRAPQRMYSRVLTGVGASIAAETDGVPGLGLASASAAAKLLIVGCW